MLSHSAGGTRWWQLGLAMWLAWGAGIADACRYNVRDIGFVEVGTDAYTLFGYVDRTVPAEVLRGLKQQGERLERETNLRFVLVDEVAEPDHPGRRHRASSLKPAPPQGVLVAPGGQVLPVLFPPFDERFPAAWEEVLKGLAVSPKREEIVRSVSQTFAAVLLLQGTATEANARARKTIQAAITRIQGEMKSLPKAIAEPPVLLELSPAEFASEKVLLWSLGLDPQPAQLPAAAVFYGKGRWIGQLLRGEEIAEPSLMKVLSIIGADCECGIDISWTQGVRLPLRWSSELAAQIAQSLGFDPENPLIRIEASRILSKRGTGGAKSQSRGYQEVALPDEDGPAHRDSSRTSSNALASVGLKPTASRVIQAVEPAGGGKVMRRSWATVAALALIAAALGVGFFLRYRVKE